MNAAAESRGESYLLWLVKLLTRIVGKSSLTKKTSHYILKRKSAKLTPKKKNSLRSNETFSIIWSNICFEEDESKNYKVVAK